LVTVDGSLTNNVRVWDRATGQTVRSFGNLVQDVSFVAGGHLVTAGSDMAVRVWDIETGQIVRTLPGAGQIVIGLESSTDSPLVLAGYADGRLITWDASTGVVQHDFVGERLVSIATIPGTNQILTAHTDKLVRVKERTILTNLRVFGGHTTSTTLGVGFSPDGRYVVSGGTEVFTRVWNRTNGLPVHLLPGHGAGTEAATFSPDGTRILTTFGAPVLSARLWNAQTGLLEREFFGHTGWLLTAVFSPDGRRVATGAQDGTARLWDVATGGHIRTFATPGTWIRAVAVSSNGQYLASGTSDGIVRLWDTASGQALRTFELNAGSVKSVAFSPATGELLVAWEDGFLRTFDPATGELKLDSITPAAFLETAVFSPDGRFILGGEGWPFFTARLWDARNGEELRVFGGHAAPVDSVAFNAAGTSILTGSDIVRQWSIADIAARLETERRPEGLELRWHIGSLQSAVNATGPWNDVTNATSPWMARTDQGSAFFRVKVNQQDVER
jgi:WD40 repeat protein